jgi:hypothetical protein
MNTKFIQLFAVLTIFFTMVLGTGCADDFLEKPKGGAVTTDTIFNTQNQARMAIAQMYNTCVKCYFPYDSPGSRPESITDQLYILHGSNDTWAGQVINTQYYVTGNMSTETSCDYGGYGSHYKGIRQANLVLENIDLVKDASDEWKTDVKGQAIFCRALQHYELFRYYGGIPIIDHSLQGDDIKYPRRSVEAVVNTIVGWCDEAAAKLPETRPAVDFGKATKLAALALKARVLLYAASPLYNTPENMKSEVTGARFGDGRDSVLCYPTYDVNRWKLAADASKAVLDNAAAAGVSLYDTDKPLTTGETYATLGDYESVWNVYANQEIIMANTKSIESPSSWGADSWSLYMSSKLFYSSWGIKNNVPNEFLQLYEKKDGSKWVLPDNGTNLPTDIQALDLDPRFYQTIAYDGMYYCAKKGYLDYYKAGDGYPEGKLCGTDGTPNGFAVEVFKFVPRVDAMNTKHFAWPVFRLAEFYLSYAEALNELSGPSQLTYDALNAIRSRAGMPSKTGLDQAGFREAIQNERTIELAYENHRYNDLLRWLTAAKVLNKPLTGIVTTAKKVNGALTRPWVKSLFINRIFPQRYYYIPFSNSEISKKYLGNGSWNGQNPGW